MPMMVVVADLGNLKGGGRGRGRGGGGGGGVCRALCAEDCVVGLSLTLEVTMIRFVLRGLVCVVRKL